jgi:hypothetical protein
MRADEIVIDTAKIGKVTAVVVVMIIFCSKRCKPRSANHGNKKPFCQKGGKYHFLGGKFSKIEKPFSENKKRLDFDLISTYIEENRAE